MPKGVYVRKLRPLESRLWARVDRSGPGGCWLWKGTRNRRSEGYGTIGMGRREHGRDYVHRVAWRLVNGEIPEGMEVCHRCDVRLCCNPAHLFLGTRKENHDDMAGKGRHVKPPHGAGEANPRAKLTADDVDFIRRHCAPGTRGDLSASALSRRFGVSYQAVLRAARGQSWATS